MTDDERLLNSVDDGILRMLEDEAGPVVQRLAQSKAATYEAIQDGEATTRFAALSLAQLKWGVTQDIAERCERLASADPDARVRGAAVVCLNRHYAKTKNPQITRLLAKIVGDNAESQDVREVAYSGLFAVRDRDVLQWPELGSGFRFPKDVDWVFVSACLGSAER